MTDAIEYVKMSKNKAKQAEEIQELPISLKKNRESQKNLKALVMSEQMLLRRKFNFKSKVEAEGVENRGI